MKTYPTLALAERRVMFLRREGIWAGIIALENGRYRLTFDPHADE